ncbi:MAG TPA: guanylate kinase [Candidatus Choladousia intestinigallinarum]|nr:guanylate kinase [Candidatus Choladousia intestinigallinarum]
MGLIFYVMGKSSSGKDTIYQDVLSREELKLKPFVMYTTRPIRARETDGVQYHFVTEEKLRQMQREGQVIELRSYDTVHGIWYYFSAHGEFINLEENDYLALGTLESYEKMKQYYGEGRMVPIYIETDDLLRLERSIKREKKQEFPNYDEVCRRYLADQQDFSEDKIKKAGIEKRFSNNEDRQVCMDQVAEYIKQRIGGEAFGD